jgi:predicted enzyme related to lactoylglutathione lyase
VFDGRLDVRRRKAMRSATVAMAMILTAATVRADPPKSQPADVGPGRVAWFDITTSSLPQSRAFYGKLFGWEFRPVKGTDQAVDIVAGETAIGTLRVAEGQINVFNGVVYIQVGDIQASCAKARELGGTVPPGFPFNLPDGTGAVGLVADPAGHPVGMYSRTTIASTAPASK